ncbi:MAG: gamma-glutamyltransferase [Bryobacteraceae bacterium]|nr:gamma-glutamyltransferase [Bryobacteraceae bacterium]MDW8378729.1 gamma-glutamyltransferase [Bryobacterales bacterium]
MNRRANGKIFQASFMPGHSTTLLLLAVGSTLIGCEFPLQAQQRSQARSMVITQRGIVATSQTLASQAGAAILARGGNAVDAAIAANAVLTVVEPMSCGVGGDLFAIYYQASSRKLYGLNASGPAPLQMSIAKLKQLGYHTMPQDGIHSVTVPGCVDGWRKLHQRFGRLPWRMLFSPARYYALEGFPLTEIIQDHWRSSLAKLQSTDYARRTFLFHGAPPEVGQVIRNPDLAKTFGLLAEQGGDVFYRGVIARAIVDTSRKWNGFLQAEDLAKYSAEWVEPIQTNYRGWTVWELPPNSQGVAALAMLNILETLPVDQYPPESPVSWHYKIEAQKLAYQDLKRYLADPKFSTVPIAQMLSKSYAAERARSIQPEKANCDPSPGRFTAGGGDTVYLATVDQEGNMVSLIQSLYLSFGSGVAVEGFGFHLHNRAALFELDPDHPNALAPGKRPFHTIIPAFMEKGSTKIAFGIMGGLNQAQAHAQFVSNLVDHGMNIQAALEAPRFTKLNFGGCDVMVEARLPETTRRILREYGHLLEVQGDFSGWMGGGQVVLRDFERGVNYGASSPRKDGAAIPEADPYFRPPSRRAPAK